LVKTCDTQLFKIIAFYFSLPYLADLYGNTTIKESIDETKLNKKKTILKKIPKKLHSKKRRKSIEKALPEEENELSFDSFLRENAEFSKEMAKLAAYEKELESYKLIEEPEVDYLYA